MSRQFAKIKPAVFGPSQQRGVVATFDIGSNECICSVPAKAALRTYPGCGPVLGVPADVWQQLPWYAQVHKDVLLTSQRAFPVSPAAFVRSLHAIKAI
jgi:hypothetical protein